MKKFIKKLLYPSDLYESLRPLVFMLFVDGIPPYKLNSSANANRSKRVILGRIIGSIYLAMFCVSYALTIGNLNIFTSFFMDYKLAQVVDTVLITSTLFAMFLVYLSAFVKKHHFCDIVKILVDVDTRLIKFGVNLNHRKSVLALMKFSAVTAVVYFFYVIGSYQLLSMFNHRAYLYTWISYFMPHYILALILFKYLTITKIIRHRFATLNKVSCW